MSDEEQRCMKWGSRFQVSRPPLVSNRPSAECIILVRMPSGACRVILVAALAFLPATRATFAQERVTLRTHVMLYGDNTEFFNPFRDGATLLGAAARVAVDVGLNESVTFSGGLFMNHRFGSMQIAEIWAPVFKLAVHSEHQRFVVGTLDTFERADGFGPDSTGPHGLLPPLQRETLVFERPYEAGLQWKMDTPRLRQDAWVNWQNVNTEDRRERFDVGINGRLPVGTKVALSVAYQFHLVHEGGQLHANGPVRDSWAIGPGLIIEPTFWFFDRTTVEGYALLSRHVPDRSNLSDSRHGHGVFARTSGEKDGWRGHLIFWGARGWIKEEGDENYGSLRQDGTRFRNTRHYGEVGLTKIFYPAEGVELEGSARLHRIEKDYNYSYRVLARVGFKFPVWVRQ